MERPGIIAIFFLIITAGVLGYVLGIVLQAGDINEELNENAFFKDCNLNSSSSCDYMHLSLAMLFIVFSVVTIFLVYRNADSFLTPLLWYYFTLMTGFGLRFLL